MLTLQLTGPGLDINQIQHPFPDVGWTWLVRAKEVGDYKMMINLERHTLTSKSGKEFQSYEYDYTWRIPAALADNVRVNPDNSLLIDLKVVTEIKLTPVEAVLLKAIAALIPLTLSVIAIVNSLRRKPKS